MIAVLFDQPHIKTPLIYNYQYVVCIEFMFTQESN